MSDETKEYFDALEKKARGALLRRRYFKAALSSREPNETTFAGKIPAIPLRPRFVCDDEKASCVVERDSKNIDSDYKVLSKRPPRTYWRGNQKNK